MPINSDCLYISCLIRALALRYHLRTQAKLSRNTRTAFALLSDMISIENTGPVTKVSGSLNSTIWRIVHTMIQIMLLQLQQVILRPCESWKSILYLECLRRSVRRYRLVLHGRHQTRIPHIWYSQGWQPCAKSLNIMLDEKSQQLPSNPKFQYLRLQVRYRSQVGALLSIYKKRFVINGPFSIGFTSLF
jgi:hypothetical protein